MTRKTISGVWALLTLLAVSFGPLQAQDQIVTDYRIGPKDLLELTVIGFQDLNRQYRVSEEGKISLPYLGELQVEGMTKSDLEKRLVQLLGEKYLENPQVSVVIVEHQSRRVFLIGAVPKPGPYELMGRLTLLKLISQAGGLTADAGSEIVVMRQLPDGDKTSLKIPVEDLLLKGDASLDIPLQSDDIISVPLNIMVQIYVTGQVKNAGAFSVRKSNIPTLLRAIAQAGGFSERADKGDVIIKRFDESGKEIRIKVDVNNIIKGKDTDVQLRENDVVIVSERLV
jgi:polysaccharide export outer membrane protein